MENEDYKLLVAKIKEAFAAVEQYYLSLVVEINSANPSFEKLQRVKDTINEEKDEFNDLVDRLYHRGMLQLKIDIDDTLKSGDWVFLDTNPKNPDVGVWDETKSHYANIDVTISAFDVFNLD